MSSGEIGDTIEAELAGARVLLASGLPRERLYAAAVEKNYEKPEPPKDGSGEGILAEV